MAVDDLTCAYRITRHDPLHRDERGAHTGPERCDSDHGPVEASFLAAVATVLGEAGVSSLRVETAERLGRARTGMPGPEPDHGIPAHFGPGGRGFHDGAAVPLDVALHLVRAMLRDEGLLWCRLAAPGRAIVEVGNGLHIYIGLAEPVQAAVEQVLATGLVGEPWSPSWFDREDDTPPADEHFWVVLGDLVQQHRRLLVEERQAGHWVVWHEVDRTSLQALRSAVLPGARLVVWPPMDGDLGVVVDRASAGERDAMELVWRGPTGLLSSRLLDESDAPADIEALLHDAGAAQLTDCWWPPEDGLVWGRVPAAALS